MEEVCEEGEGEGGGVGNISDQVSKLLAVRVVQRVVLLQDPRSETRKKGLSESVRYLLDMDLVHIR